MRIKNKTKLSLTSKANHSGFADLGFAKVDLHRRQRQGHGEVIFAPGKSNPQLVSIAQKLLEHEGFVLVSRVDPLQAKVLLETFSKVQWHESARIVTIGKNSSPTLPGYIAVICAGTSDVPVAEEAAIVAESFGQPVKRFYDVGVAGLHRLLAHESHLRKARALIVVAGMEGALPSVVAGLVDRPVIAVPTSVGYGASFGGVAALLGMLNSCGSGVTVVNIDNGFGAAFAAVQINRLSTIKTDN